MIVTISRQMGSGGDEIAAAVAARLDLQIVDRELVHAAALAAGVPADLLNHGRFAVGMNASTYNIRRYFEDEQALDFNVDVSGAPGMQWAETRQGPVRPRLEWSIETK